MSTFAKGTFDFARYAAARPTYPRQLYDFVFKYHERSRGAKWDLAVDLGCGTGQATVELTAFKRVIGVDPSNGMIEKAKAYAAQVDVGKTAQVEFVHSSAEELPFLEDGSVDLLVAAQAAHWFNWDKVWPEVARVLRKDGSAAFWGYSEFRLSNYPKLTPLITQYSQGSDPEKSLGPHWQQPGRSIVDNHFLDVPKATDVLPDKFSEWEHVFFTGEHHPDLKDARPTILRKKMKWEDLHAYLHSFSSLHTYLEKYPQDKENPEGDIATRFFKTLQKETGEPEYIDVEWPMAVMLVKRK
ncbi:S-adenosyl-L-methionine-dependent methyltransferase [Peniophora sp. CONT]|nr:S-adenosyl-L-methionine-dependent methyltransferase [Peniophora sp. CONT]